MSFFAPSSRLVSSLVLVVVLGACERNASKQAPKPKPQIDLTALRAKAEQGNPEFQAQLGRLYLKGEAVTNSYTEAARWFQLAAEKGNPDAEAGLGELYEAGQGVPQDMKKALLYYRQAADKGHAGAQYTLGFMAECGRGVPQDQVEAAKWFRKAAEQGEPLSQFDLGQRYGKGIGVPVDLAESFKWLKLASDQKQPDAMALLNEVRKKMNAAETAEARKRLGAFRAEKTAGSNSNIRP